MEGSFLQMTRLGKHGKRQPRMVAWNQVGEGKVCGCAIALFLRDFVPRDFPLLLSRQAGHQF